MKKEYLCLCGHGSYKHNKLGLKAWIRFDKQLEGYEDSKDTREKFWKRYLANGVDDEWACSQCDCESFKMDNLQYLEELYEAKNK